jgi:hypothetical protein
MAMRSSADYYNVAVGSMALQNMIGKAGASPGSLTTQFNTALGYQAGKIQTDLNRCTLIGANTDMSGNAFTDITCLGYNAKAGANFATAIGSGVYNATANSVRIGRSSDKVFIDGGLVATKGSSTYAIDVSGNMNIDNGKLVIQSSSNNNQIYNQTEFNNYTYYSYLAEFNGDIKVTGTSYTPRFYTELSSNNNIVITNDVSLNIQSNSRINMYDLYGKVGEWSDSKFEVSVPINANGGINIDGNAIENLYVDISNNQVIVGQKKFTSNRTYFNEFSFLTMDASKNIFMTRNNTISQAGEGNIIIGGTDITGSGNMTTSATNNTAFGSSTLTNLTSGRENQVYGYSSGASITTGIQNIVGGFFCGYYITTGQNNVAWGSNCFDKLTTGNYNSALGDNAGKEAKTSNKCSFIGWNSGQDSSGNTYSDSTALGAGATITGSNQVVLGTSSDTTIPKGKLLHNGVYQNYYDNTFISSNTTLNFPCNETHVVYETGAQFTITLPEITSASQLGAKLIFTLVTDNGAGIYFIRQGTNNKLIPKGTTTAYTTSYELLNTGSFKTSTMLVAVRHTTTNTNYVWREI